MRNPFKKPAPTPANDDQGAPGATIAPGGEDVSIVIKNLADLETFDDFQDYLHHIIDQQGPDLTSITIRHEADRNLAPFMDSVRGQLKNKDFTEGVKTGFAIYLGLLGTLMGVEMDGIKKMEATLGEDLDAAAMSSFLNYATHLKVVAALDSYMERNFKWPEKDRLMFRTVYSAAHIQMLALAEMYLGATKVPEGATVN